MNEVALPGTIYVCGACGKISRDRYGETAQASRGWEASCMMNSSLCFAPPVVEVDDTGYAMARWEGVDGLGVLARESSRIVYAAVPWHRPVKVKAVGTPPEDRYMCMVCVAQWPRLVSTMPTDPVVVERHFIEEHPQWMEDPPPRPHFVGYRYDTLTKGRPLKAGDTITCPHCNAQHAIEDSGRPGILLYYKCGEKTYMAGIAGRSTMGLKPDTSGEL